MPTPFPYNRLATIPSLIAGRLSPLINNITQKLLETSDKIKNKIETLSSKATCNDIDILKIRNLLEELVKYLALLETLLLISRTIINVLQYLRIIGQSAATAATLATPTTGAVAAQGQAAADLASNSSTAGEIILLCIDNLIKILPGVIVTIKTADQLLNNICNENNDNISDLFPDASVISVTPEDLLDQYPSTFYTELNVSDEDLNTRYREIVQLLNEGFSVINNLVELPTNVLTGQGAPAETTGTAGDFYIDTQTNQLFGPKPTNGSWT